MGRTLKIVMDRPYYFSGSVVSGTLTVELDIPKQFRQIQVGMIGKAQIEWTRTVNNGNTSTTYSYKDVEDYAQSSLTLWKNEDAPNGELPTGVHSFPFQLPLPHNVPSSFEGLGWGWIRYTVEGKIDGGYLANDQTSEVQVIVYELINLKEASLLRPQSFQKEKGQVGCFCCASGPVSFSFELPCSGFSRGETISFPINITNGSARKVRMQVTIKKMATFTLVEKRLFATNTETKRETETVTGVTSEQIPARQTIVWNPEVVVPTDIVPSIVKKCRFITVKYFLKVKLIVPWGLDESVAAPIVIGYTPERIS